MVWVEMSIVHNYVAFGYVISKISQKSVNLTEFEYQSAIVVFITYHVNIFSYREVK